jgi:hypothetical protein
MVNIFQVNCLVSTPEPQFTTKQKRFCANQLFAKQIKSELSEHFLQKRAQKPGINRVFIPVVRD